MMHRRVSSGLTIRDLRFVCYRFFLFSADTQNHNLPTNWPYIWSPGLICCTTCTFSRTGFIPGAPGARRGPPEGRKTAEKPRAEFIWLSSLRSVQPKDEITKIAQWMTFGGSSSNTLRGASRVRASLAPKNTALRRSRPILNGTNKETES